MLSGQHLSHDQQFLLNITTFKHHFIFINIQRFAQSKTMVLY